jgi:predicted glycogen debranching enzyme
MSYIKFDKSKLINLEYSLNKELLRTNRAGSYASTTIVGCNTRKYHGLLVALQPQIDMGHHVLLSTLDVTVIQRNAEFNLAIHNYGENSYDPRGHKYIRDFESEPIPKLTYRVGGVIMTKERVYVSSEDRFMIRFEILEAHSATKLRFKPLLAFRSVHSLSKQNDYADTSYTEIKNGIKVRMYEPYSDLYLQFSRKPKYAHNPDWNYNIEYPKERTRGYEYREDLYMPGIFELSVKKGDVIVFSAGLNEIEPKKLRGAFAKETVDRVPRDTFIHCLENAAEQFLVEREGNTELIAGYHWFHICGRTVFVSLPGLLLTQNDTDHFLSIVDTMISKMQGPFFPITDDGSMLHYSSVDASLWFFLALQRYIEFTGDDKLMWEKYGKVMKKILEEYKKGTSYNIHMQNDGLLYAGGENDVLTWMNTVIDGKPVVNRNGLAVEINGLWYNAIKFYIELNERYGKGRTSGWRQITEKIEKSFIETFWDSEKELMADCVRGDFKDFSVRPNQVILTALPYSPVNDDIKYAILQIAEGELLTPRGLRTLSPKTPSYKGVYKGDIIQRDLAYHNGSAFPWLLGFFVEGYLKLHRKSGVSFAKKLLNGFEPEMTEHGIGTISELYYGDPPYRGKGAISQAWSVSELLRINYLINKVENQSDPKR